MTGLWKISHRWILLHGLNVILAFVALSPSLWICGVYDAKTVVFMKLQSRSVLILLFFILTIIYWDLSPITQFLMSPLSFSMFCLQSFELRNKIHTIYTTSSTIHNKIIRNNYGNRRNCSENPANYFYLGRHEIAFKIQLQSF